MAPRDEARPSHRHHDSGAKRHHHHKKRPSSSRHHASASEESRSGRSSHALSADALARLNNLNTRTVPAAESPQQRRERRERRESRNVRPTEDGLERERERERRERRQRREQRKRESRTRDAYRAVERDDDDDEYRSERRRERRTSKKHRVVSGAALEEGRSQDLRGMRGGGNSSLDSLDKEGAYYQARPPMSKKKKKRLWILAACGVVVLIIIIVAAVVASKKKKKSDDSGSSSSVSNIPPDSIPSDAPDYLNPHKWADTTDFNLTYTAEMVGDLPIMGLNTSWDDSKAANDMVPALDKDWGSYSTTPARGVNLGGWLSLEPFITPDLFNYDSNLGIIDEWTLCANLGDSCASTLEKHYSTFVTEQTFAEIADAGLDHVRIPYSYWAVETFPGDPYLFRTSWRYLLRGIEWARKYGLRVNLDLHGLPGSQNGWNHSGHQGPIGWMNGTDGDINVQRSVDIHDRLSQFFAQDRYTNVISHYGLANEPRMTFLPVDRVISWTEQIYALARKNGVKKAIVVFGDGFMGLENWQGRMTGYDNLALDVHQYVIFNNNQIDFNHTRKITYACNGWTQQTEQSMDTSTGYGPTLVAEWSQADTDCATYLTNVGWGNRWTGTYDTGNASDPLNALTPRCPTLDDQCDCSKANADPSAYSDDYKSFLKAFAEAQMYSFEKGWGWFYWTWWTSEGSTQWSYKRGLDAGILPEKAYDRDFNCDLSSIPSFSSLPETY